MLNINQLLIWSVGINDDYTVKVTVMYNEGIFSSLGSGMIHEFT